MSSFVPNKHHLQEVLIFCFNWKKSAAEAHRMLVEVYGDSASSDKSCREWFRWFKSGDFSVEDKERSGQPKKFEDEELETLLDQDSCQTQEELAKTLEVTQQAISKRLKAARIETERYRTTILHVRDVAWTVQKEVFSASNHYRGRKMDSLRQPKTQKIVCKARPTGSINAEAEYPWCQGNALYLVGSEGCDPLWAAKTWSNHHGRLLQATIDPFKASYSRKTSRICDQTRVHNLSPWQRSASCCCSG